MRIKTIPILVLTLWAALPLKAEVPDSVQLFVQLGDSCMQQYNTFEALGYYQQAFDMKDTIDVRTKLADCHYKRGNYRQTAELLKNIPEDSLSHDAFRQLCFSYQKQGDNDSFIFWASQFTYYYPMDGEVVANLILAHIKAQQPQNGIIHNTWGQARCEVLAWRQT